MNKKLKQLIKTLKTMHKETLAEPSTLEEQFAQNDYLINKNIFAEQKVNWLKKIYRSPESFFNMPTDLFKLYDFTVVALEEANKCYTKSICKTSNPQQSKKAAIEAFQVKLVEKTGKEYEKIENEKREAKSAAIIKFMEDVNRAAKR